MKIAVASDHRGVEAKARILEMVRELGHDGVDYGPVGEESVDYPDFAAKVAGDVAGSKLDRGILICGTGIGMCIAANKFDGVRAAHARDDLDAQLSRLHNDANVLCLSAELIGDAGIDRIIRTWVTTEFEGGRHARRLDKISDIENNRNCINAEDGSPE